jgi:hypothetical protein
MEYKNNDDDDDDDDDKLSEVSRKIYPESWSDRMK